MSDIDDVQSVVAGVVHTIDGKDWPSLRALYADEVAVDYTSLSGGTPQRQRGDELIAGWKKQLAAVSTQHLLGPITVALSGSTAEAQCHVRAWHIAEGAPGGDEWVVGGHYIFQLAQSDGRWTITAITLETLQQSGNRQLLQEAQSLS